MVVDIHRKIHEFTCGASCRYGRSVSNKKKGEFVSSSFIPHLAHGVM